MSEPTDREQLRRRHVRRRGAVTNRKRMQGRAWYVVLADWLLTVAGILGIAYGLFGLVVTLWAAKIGYHTPGFSLVQSAISDGASLAIAAAAWWAARHLRRGAAESRRST